MRNSLIIVSLVCFLGAFASCQKKSPESLLPDATHSGAWTIGFLVNGEPRYTSGKLNGSMSEGVNLRLYMDSTAQWVSSGEKGTRFELSLRFKFSNKVGLFPLSHIHPCGVFYFEPENGSTVPTKDNQYKIDESHTGQINVMYWDGSVIAGTFEMEIVNGNGKVLHITQGRFDIPME